MRPSVVAVVASVLLVLRASAQVGPGKIGTGPSQAVQIQKQIELLKAHQGPSPFLTIQEKGGDAIVQVARIGEGAKAVLSLNIAFYPSQEPPAKALASAGMLLPATWKQEEFNPGVNAQVAVPKMDEPRLPAFIRDLFVKFFKRPATCELEFFIESSEPMSEVTPKPEIKFSMGNSKSMDAKDSAKEGQVVSFNGLVSTLKQNGQLVEARIGNMDDGMKTTYGIVLDKKGKQLAEVKGSVHVTGRVEIKHGKNMLVVEEFAKKQAERVSLHGESPQTPRAPAPQPAAPKMTQPVASAAPKTAAGSTSWLEAKQLDRVDLAGNWQLTLPAGFILTTEVSRASSTQYQLSGARILNGTYELQGNEWVLVSPVNASMTGAAWRFKGPGSLVLVTSPSRGPSDYSGATLKRIK